jgi:hypothetical protein
MATSSLPSQIGALEQKIAHSIPAGSQASLNSTNQGIITGNGTTTAASQETTALLAQLAQLRLEDSGRALTSTSRHPLPQAAQLLPPPGNGATDTLSQPSPLESQARRANTAAMSAWPQRAEPFSSSVSSYPSYEESVHARQSRMEHYPFSSRLDNTHAPAHPIRAPLFEHDAEAPLLTSRHHDFRPAAPTRAHAAAPASTYDRDADMLNTRFIKNKLEVLKKALQETEESISFLEGNLNGSYARGMTRFFTAGRLNGNEDAQQAIAKYTQEKTQMSANIAALEAILTKTTAEKAERVKARVLQEQCQELEATLQGKNISLDGQPLTINPHAYFTLAELAEGNKGEINVKAETTNLDERCAQLSEGLKAYEHLKSLETLA